jgi:lycopene beta-cyclase
LGERVLTGASVSNVTPSRVNLTDGRTIEAGAVLDARGGGDLSALSCGWQKFVGQELHLATPHRLTRPVIMDARVPQRDGYRFVYVLPTGQSSVFVEDTYYSDEADLDVPALETRIAAYARRRGWIVDSVSHQEAGVLPVVMAGRFDRFWPVDDPIARAGVRAGLFHPMTGYSLVEAVAFASALAQIWPLESEGLAAFSRAWARSRWRKGGYYRMLARMLFRAAPPNERHRVFERFYGLSEELIERFYAGRSTRRDKLRILCGRPPVPIRSAMHSLIDTSTR